MADPAAAASAAAGSVATGFASPSPPPALEKPCTTATTPTVADPWFMLAALLTVAAAADGQAALAPRPSHATHQLWTMARPDPDTPPPGAKPAAATTFRHPDGGMYSFNQRYRRQISSATDMRFLHIPREMAEALIPDIMAYQISRPGRKKAPVRMGTAGRPVFAARVSLIDQDGRTWPVLFRTYVTGKQYHRRLTDGWRPFAAHHGLTAGDAVHFWRRPEDERVDALVMRVQVVRGMLS